MMKGLISEDEKPAIRYALIGGAFLLAGVVVMFAFSGYLWSLKGWLALPVILTLTMPLLAGAACMLTSIVLFISAWSRSG